MNKEEMAKELSKYFSVKGTDRSSYVSDPAAPFPIRDVKRAFKNFELAILAASRVKVKVEAVKPKVPSPVKDEDDDDGQD